MILPRLRAAALRRLRSRFAAVWLASFAGQVVQSILQAASFVLLARFLGVHTFGVKVGLGAVAAMAGPVAGFGFGNLLVRNVARAPDAFAESWGNALLVTAVTSAAISAAAVPVALLLLPAAPPAPVVAAIFFSELVCARLIAIAGTAFQARGRIADMARVGSLFQVARLLTVLLCLAISPASSRLSWWAGISGVVSSAIAVVILRDAWRRLGRARPSLVRIRAEWRDGLQFVLSPYTQIVNNDADKLVLGQYATLAVVGAYGAAYRVISAACVPLQSLLTVTYPLFFEHGVGGIRASRRFARSLATYALPTGALGALAILLGSRVLVELLGPGYEETAVILRWLSVIPVFKAVQFLFADALTGAGFQRRRTAIQAGAALLNVLLNLALDPTWGWAGATVATLASDASLAVALGLGTVWIKDPVARLLPAAQPAAPPR